MSFGPRRRNFFSDERQEEERLNQIEEEAKLLAKEQRRAEKIAKQKVNVSETIKAGKDFFSDFFSDLTIEREAGEFNNDILESEFEMFVERTDYMGEIIDEEFSALNTINNVVARFNEELTANNRILGTTVDVGSQSSNESSSKPRTEELFDHTSSRKEELKDYESLKLKSEIDKRNEYIRNYIKMIEPVINKITKEMLARKAILKKSLFDINFYYLPYLVKHQEDLRITTNTGWTNFMTYNYNDTLTTEAFKQHPLFIQFIDLHGLTNHIKTNYDKYIKHQLDSTAHRMFFNEVQTWIKNNSNRINQLGKIVLIPSINFYPDDWFLKDHLFIYESQRFPVYDYVKNDKFYNHKIKHAINIKAKTEYSNYNRIIFIFRDIIKYHRIVSEFKPK